MAPTEDLNMFSILLPVAGVIFVIAVGVILLTQHFRKNLFRQMAAQEELKHAHQKALLMSSIEVQERERKRIAQDLHDELGASLSIARMHLVQLEEQTKNATNIDLQYALQNVRTMAETAMASMRRISHELMPPQLEVFGLVKTLESVASQINGVGVVTIHLETEPELMRPSWIVELGLYRMTMELINNTLKHAEAKDIFITISTTNKNIQVFYRDNGKGLQGSDYSHGLGLKNLEARASALKGTFEMGSSGSVGFSARLSVPLE